MTNTPARVPVLTNQQWHDVSFYIDQAAKCGQADADAATALHACLEAIADGRHRIIDLQDPALPTTLDGLLKGSGYCVVQDWRPIATSPRGKIPFLAAIFDGGDYDDIRPVYWHFDTRAMWNANTGNIMHEAAAAKYTHWMPLPPSPLAPTKENDGG